MERLRPGPGWLFVIAAALMASVSGHRLLEALTAKADVASAYGGYRHIALAPAMLLAVIFVSAGICALLLRRKRKTTPFGRRDAVVAGALAVASLDLKIAAATIFTLQLALLYAMENLEHALALGSGCSGLEWLGGPPTFALLVHALLACVASIALRRSLAHVIAGCDAILATLAALVAFFRPICRFPAAVPRGPRGRAVVRAVSRRAVPTGLRAPPALG